MKKQFFVIALTCSMSLLQAGDLHTMTVEQLKQVQVETQNNASQQTEQINNHNLNNPDHPIDFVHIVESRDNILYTQLLINEQQAQGFSSEITSYNDLAQAYTQLKGYRSVLHMNTPPNNNPIVPHDSNHVNMNIESNISAQKDLTAAKCVSPEITNLKNQIDENAHKFMSTPATIVLNHQATILGSLAGFLGIGTVVAVRNENPVIAAGLGLGALVCGYASRTTATFYEHEHHQVSSVDNSPSHTQQQYDAAYAFKRYEENMVPVKNALVIPADIYKGSTGVVTKLLYTPSKTKPE